MDCHDEVDAYPSRLLDDYLTVARRRHPSALRTTALRTRSYGARHILARAVGAGLTLPEVLDLARNPDGPLRGKAKELDPAAIAELAYVIALQGLRDTDQRDGLALYELALRRGGPGRLSKEHQGVHVQLAYHLGDPVRAAELLALYENVPPLVRATVELDLVNPFRTGGPVDEWLPKLRPLLADAPIVLSEDDDLPPFDRLTVADVEPFSAEQRISVVMTSFRPGQELVTAVRSVLAQSWRNLEVLLVDDGSSDEYDAVLKQCVGLDDRVRLIRLEHNSGTYTARNVAFDVATGDFVAFHDSDDWMHPDRLRTHVEPLIANPDLVATISHALTANDDLVLTRVGRQLDPLSTPSLLFRKREVLDRLGYLDSTRKAADTEFLKRIEATFGRKAVLRIRSGLYTLMRQAPGSLSRAEFGACWRHPAREAYQSAYLPWHDRIRSGAADPYLGRQCSARKFAVPARFGREPVPPQPYDVVFALDWRPYGGPQKSAIEEIKALVACGRRVGVMHLESFRHMTERQRPLGTEIVDLINGGTVDQVLPTDEAETALFILRYPPILQFRVHEKLSIRARKVIILANQAPAEADGTDLRYVPDVCHDIAREMFGVEPLWVPQGPMVRNALAEFLAPGRLADFHMPGLMDVAHIPPPRTGFRSKRPVIGRHSRDDWTKWPADRETTLALYPDSDDVDVRILGGAKAAAKLLRGEPCPNWLVYPYNEIDPWNFLYQLDFYVYFPHPSMIEAFGRAVLEALTAGCVTFLPDRFAETFGDAAVYCRPDEVRSAIDDYYADVDRFVEQSRRAQQRVAERFSHASYAELVTRLIAEPPTRLEEMTG